MKKQYITPKERYSEIEPYSILANSQQQQSFSSYSANEDFDATPQLLFGRDDVSGDGMND